MSPDARSSGREFLAIARQLIERLESEEWENISAAAVCVADALEGGHSIHAFGTGHSHMLAEELFYRAGGLVQVKPILFEGLMLHASAPLSTSLERLDGLAAALLKDHPIALGDVLIVASNSGSNAVSSELVQLVKELGVTSIALTSLHHAMSTSARSTKLPRLHELADIVIDNGGAVGDAAIAVDGFAKRIAPTSTIVGAAILNTIVAEAVQLLIERGVRPEVYSSSNLDGGDKANASYVAKGLAR